MSAKADSSPLSNAGEHLGLARDYVTVGVADAVNAGVDAAQKAKAELNEKLEKLLVQGSDMLRQAEELIRSRPGRPSGPRSLRDT